MYHRKHFLFLASIMLLTLCISACSSGQVEISDAWARPGFANENSAAYFTINNPTLKNDTLLGAASDVAGTVELHESIMSGSGHSEQMEMVPQDSVHIRFLREVKFEPGGLHVMLIGLTQDLQEGDTFTLTLQFENSGDVELVIPIIQQ
jgi:copper(I)-binding protein